MNNEAFIDAQNLRLGTIRSNNPWQVDLNKFLIYLKEKYHIKKAYYFLGYKVPSLTKMYKAIESYGYTLVFKETLPNTVSSKKGNVDTDIVFETMKKSFEDKKLEKILLVSGDGDYFKTVKYLIENNKFLKILGPDRMFMSALYKKKLHSKYYSYLSDTSIINKLKL